MRRQTDEFDIYSVAGGGVALYMRIWSDPASATSGRPKVGVVCLPLAGEQACGDAWSAIDAGGCTTLLVVDGLGHGPEAARASQAAITLTEAAATAELPAALMGRLHAALRGTRGAAVAIARVDFRAAELLFAGVGNIAAAIHESDSRRHLVSHNGIVGSNLPQVQGFRYRWGADSLLILHSDGIAAKWDLKQYPGLVFRHPSLVAGVLFRDFARANDDATLLVMREH